ILNSHLDIESPYNTYKYAGLPPGPINFPEVTTIDAVLNFEKHTYIYMCAKEDFSGYHNFASTLAQHNRNAALYRTALNSNRIWK
ncbi:MAG: aminodeoxychorismate lyase, partial [Desulfobacula sp.]|nr:aminodeoxychorismate lyase [Desulfobacula sp.]